MLLTRTSTLYTSRGRDSPEPVWMTERRAGLLSSGIQVAYTKTGESLAHSSAVLPSSLDWLLCAWEANESKTRGSLRDSGKLENTHPT